MYEHILVPLDGSARAEVALPIAAQVARAAGSSVILLQVVSIPVNYGYVSGPDKVYGYGGGRSMSYGYGGDPGSHYASDVGLVSNSMITEQDRETAQIDATAYLTELANSDLFAGIPTTTEVVFGQPAPQILAFMEQKAVSLIILCRTGRTGFLRWALGSVAQRIVHHSRVPMLVLRAEGSALPVRSADATHLPCVAVALDGSSLAETALLPAAHLAAALAQHTQGVIQLLHVIKPHVFETDNDVLTPRDVEEVEHAQAYLQRVREDLLARTGDLNILVTCSVTPSSDVTEAIMSATEKGNESTAGSECDALAMATHGLGGVGWWVMGSVTERVLNTTTLPMLIIRPQVMAESTSEVREAQVSRTVH